MQSFPAFRKKPLAAVISAAALFSVSAVAAEDTEEAQELDAVTVQSSTIADRFEAKREQPSNIGFISGETVDREHTENIQEMLRRIPGVTTETQTGDSLKIHLRGVENQVFMGEKPGVAVVIDGVPVFERTGRVNIDMDNIESIRVIKGGASYLFGDDALSGAVIITTKRGAKQAGVTVGAEAGSYGYRKGLGRVGYAGENSSGHIQVSRREKDGYHEDSQYKADYINGKWQYFLDMTSDVTVGFELSDREKGSHGTVKGETAAHEDPESEDPNNEYNDYANNYEVDLQKYYVTYNKDIGATSNLMLNAYQYVDDTVFNTNPDDDDPDLYTYANDYDQVQQGVKAEYRSGSPKLGWLVGADLRDNTYENSDTYNIDVNSWSGSHSAGDPHNFNETEESVTAFYGELKYRATNRLTMTLNGRTDRIDLEYTDDLDPADNGDEDFNVQSWRLGGNYAVRSNFDVYANVSTGFRAPSPEQLFVGSSNPTSEVLPNPDLDPEYSFNKEIGIRTRTTWLGRPLDLDVAIFQLDREDHIQASAGQYTTGIDNQYANIGDMRHRGLELSAFSDDGGTWSWDVAYTYLDAEYTEYDEFYLRTCDSVNPFSGRCDSWSSEVFDNAGNDIPRVPKHHLNGLLRYRPDAYWTISGEVDLTSSIYADEINRVEVGGRTIYNLLVNYDRQFGNQDWSFFARVDNIFDHYYYNSVRGYRDSNLDGVYDNEDVSITVNEGRTYTAGLQVTF